MHGGSFYKRGLTNTMLVILSYALNMMKMEVLHLPNQFGLPIFLTFPNAMSFSLCDITMLFSCGKVICNHD